MSALVSTCGAAASMQVIHLSPAAGVSILLAVLVVGMLLAEGMHRFLDAGDEQIAEALAAAQDESLAMITEVTAPYTGAVSQVPAQRVTNGEDLLRGDPR